MIPPENINKINEQPDQYPLYILAQLITILKIKQNIRNKLLILTHGQGLTASLGKNPTSPDAKFLP